MTPAITLQQIREGISRILLDACQCTRPSRVRSDREKWTIRKELAIFYHLKRRNCLAPLPLERRQI